MIASGAAEDVKLLQLRDPLWVEFVARHPQATVFHDPAWTEVLSRTYGYTPSIYALVSDEGEVLAGLPFLHVQSRLTGSRRIGIPFTDHAPPLCLPGWEEQYADALSDWAADGSPVEVHAGLPVSPDHLLSAGVRHLLPLGDLDAIQRSLTRTPVGRALRKGERSDLVTSVDRSLDAVATFYRLHSLTRRRQGVPVQPFRFFALLHEHVIQPGLGMVVTASLSGRAVAAAVFLGSNGTLVYKYGASDPSFLALRPNNVVMWRAIEWGCRQGYRTLDFGKTDLDNEGLRRYKRGWGAVEVPHHHTVFPNAPTEQRNGLALRAAGAVIRRSPVIAARAIGELLYGHYA